MELNKNQMRLKMAFDYFAKSTSVLDEADSAFAPVEGMMTTAQQIAHAAHTIEWFIDGMMSDTGVETDFAAIEKEIMAVTSVTAAREWLKKASDRALALFGELSDADLAQPIKGEIMGGMPRASAIGGLIDHHAHHRGALTVYARLRGKVPEMPYM